MAERSDRNCVGLEAGEVPGIEKSLTGQDSGSAVGRQASLDSMFPAAKRKTVYFQYFECLNICINS